MKVKIFLISLTLLLLSLLSVFVYYTRPLIKTSKIKVTSLYLDQPIDNSVYHMLGRPSVTFIRMHHKERKHPVWFAVLPKSKSVIRVYGLSESFPYYSFNHDRQYGVSITSQKNYPYVGEVNWMESQIDFEYKDFKVSLPAITL